MRALTTGSVTRGNNLNDCAKLRSQAMGLVATLDRTEVKVLACLLEGRPRKDIASCFDLSLDEVEDSFRSIMRKLQAHRIAGAVRIGICAGFERPRETASQGVQARLASR